MHRCGWLIVALLLAIAVGATAKERVWTSSDGRTMRGEFVRELDGEVTFLVGGKLQTVPLDRLSERDQQIVRDLAAGKEVPDDPTPATAPSSVPAAGDPFAPRADDPFAGPPTGKNPPADESRKPADLEPTGDAPSLTKNRPKAPVSRVWTDNQGRLTTGKFVRIFNGNVVLTRAGGPVTIPFFDLTEADQQYVKDLLTSRGEEALIPVRPAAAAASDIGGGTAPMGSLPGASPGAGPTETTPMPMPGYVPAGSSSGGYSPSPYDGQSRLDDPLSQPSANAAAQSAGGTTPQYENTTGRVPMCSACKSKLSESEAQGTRCPRCGTQWAFNLHSNPASSPTSTASSSAAGSSGDNFELFDNPESERAFYGALLLVGVFAVVVAVVIGVIAVALAIASASRTGRRYREDGP